MSLCDVYTLNLPGTSAYWGSVGNKGIIYIGIIFPYSLLRTSKLIASAFSCRLPKGPGAACKLARSTAGKIVSGLRCMSIATGMRTVNSYKAVLVGYCR